MTDRENEIVVERELDAPRAMVWRAWTDPDRLAKWWGPIGFTTTTADHEFVTGGRWRFTMHGPDGRDYENLITFEEIVEPEVLRYRHGGADDVEPVNFSVLVRFEAVGEKRTKLTMRMRFASDEARRHVIDQYGADHGAVETVGRLAEHIAGERGSGWRHGVSRVIPTEGSLIVSRVFEAPLRRVWRAWTDVEMISVWFCPEECEVQEVSGDLRVGGAYRESMLCNGKVWRVHGLYREIEPEKRLVFTHQWEEPGSPETVVTVTFRAMDGARTEVTLKQTGLLGAESTASHTDGWASAFENLAKKMLAFAGA